MAVRTVPFKILDLNSVDDYIDYISTMINYLEKANGNDLGDFTPEGKIANAGYENYTVYWDWYKFLKYGNLQGQPYCAGFLSTSFASGYGLEKAKALFGGDLFVYCPTGYNRFKTKKAIYTTPKKGDIAFFWSTDLGRWGHVGFVIGVDSDGKGYTTIEANTTSGNDVVVRNGGATCRKHYTIGARRVEFGRPDYKAQGISLSKADKTNVTYNIGTGVKGLRITATSLNVRKDPGLDAAKVPDKLLKQNDSIFPTLKAFVNGTPWVYDGNYGWVSANYVEGWIQEHTNNNKWWYVQEGYTYPVNQVKVIDDIPYFFDSSGYMFIGTLIIKTDESGALKSAEIKEE